MKNNLMRLPKNRILTLITVSCSIVWLAITDKSESYIGIYKSSIESFIAFQKELLQNISEADLNSTNQRNKIKRKIGANRIQLKKIDFWLRYLEPVAYKKINGPLPVEWETEVFEKYEKPYKREGAGLSLAELYLEKGGTNKDSLSRLIEASVKSASVYLNDSITGNLNSYHHFYLANRLFLLNLATIYTTGFECPEKANIIPELIAMLDQVNKLYIAFNNSFQEFPLKDDYLRLFENLRVFVRNQDVNPENFNHYNFIKNYINPLFAIDQSYINLYSVKSNSYNDYALNDQSISIYDKKLYRGQNVKGVYSSIQDTSLLNEIRALGKLLFYDPILSGNNKRSCASCHIPKQYFTDTTVPTGLQFDQMSRLERNTPSLINVEYNHLIMLDGKHINLINQARNVLTNPIELRNKENEIVEKVLSCVDYRNKLKKFVKSSTEPEINLKHITSAIIIYYNSFSYFNAPFDDAMNGKTLMDSIIILGFNIFMSKAQCATCHFAPQFNGVKPPYIGSEFEVIGVPESNNFEKISVDTGRYLVNPAFQTLHAFRTGTIRNASHTKPYMHNGVFKTLEEVIDFYDAGGGIGKGLKIPNQSLSSDSLKLSNFEKRAIIKFIESLSEQIIFENPPGSLPRSSKDNLNNRKVGGEY